MTYGFERLRLKKCVEAKKKRKYKKTENIAIKFKKDNNKTGFLVVNCIKEQVSNFVCTPFVIM